MKKGFVYTIILLLIVASFILVSCEDEPVVPANDSPEILLTMVSDTDWDGDGLSNDEEINKWHTSPYDKDSDGDGYDDYTEAMTLYNEKTNKFNPVIADIPSLSIVMAGPPDISLVTETSEGVTKETSACESMTGTTGSSTSNSSTYNTSMEHSWQTSFSLGVKWTNSLDLVGVKFAFSLGVGGRYSISDTYTFSESSNQELSKSYSESIMNSSSNTEVFMGGLVQIPIRIVNNSDISYTITDMTLVAYNLLPDDELSPIANLYYNPSAGMPSKINITLKPGEQTEILPFITGTLSVAAMRKLLVSSCGIVAFSGGYKITYTDVNGEHDFTATLTNVHSKTALLNVDYGPSVTNKQNENYNVTARKYSKDNSGSFIPMTNRTLGEILDLTLGDAIEYYEDSDGNFKMIKSIREVDGSEYNKDMEGKWVITHSTVKNGQKVVFFYSSAETEKVDQRYNVDNIKVLAQDSIEIIYDVDKDEDGLSLRMEKYYGTDDTKVDSDDDGIDDYAELEGWETTKGDTVCTNPASDDTDGDGLKDGADDYPLITKDVDSAALNYVNLKYKLFGSSSKTTSKVTVHDIEVTPEDDTLQSMGISLLTAAYNPANAGEEDAFLNVDGGTIASSALTLEPVTQVKSSAVQCFIVPYLITNETLGENKLSHEEYNLGMENELTGNEDGTFTLTKLPVGKFKVLFKITSYSGENTEWVSILFNAPLQTPANFYAEASGESGAEQPVALSWSTLADSRATGILVVRTSLSSYAGPDEEKLIKAEAEMGNAFGTDELKYYAIGTGEKSLATSNPWDTGYKYYIYSYYYDSTKNTYVFSEGSSRSITADIPSKVDLKLELNRLTITNDHFDPGAEFELRWNFYYTLDDDDEAEFTNNTKEWNVAVISTYSFSNASFTLNDIDTSKSHTLKVRLRFIEVDTSIDDKADVYFWIKYDSATKAFYVNYEKNELSGMKLSVDKSGNKNLLDEFTTSSCVDGNLDFNVTITGTN